jgi:hypothetical protein
VVLQEHQERQLSTTTLTTELSRVVTPQEN